MRRMRNAAITVILWLFLFGSGRHIFGVWCHRRGVRCIHRARLVFGSVSVSVSVSGFTAVGMVGIVRTFD